MPSKSVRSKQSRLDDEDNASMPTSRNVVKPGGLPTLRNELNVDSYEKNSKGIGIKALEKIVRGAEQLKQTSIDFAKDNIRSAMFLVKTVADPGLIATYALGNPLLGAIVGGAVNKVLGAGAGVAGGIFNMLKPMFTKAFEIPTKLFKMQAKQKNPFDYFDDMHSEHKKDRMLWEDDNKSLSSIYKVLSNIEEYVYVIMSAKKKSDALFQLREGERDRESKTGRGSRTVDMFDMKKEQDRLKEEMSGKHSGLWGGILGGIVATIGGWFTAGLALAKPLFMKLISKVFAPIVLIKSLWDAIVEGWNQWFQTKDISNAAEGFMKTLISSMLQFFFISKETGDKIGKFFSDTVIQIFTDMFDFLIPIVAAIFSKKTWTDMFGGVLDIISSLWDKSKGFLLHPVTWILNKMWEWETAIYDGISKIDIPGAFINMITKIWEYLKEIFAPENIKGFVKELAPDWMKNLMGEDKLNTPAPQVRDIKSDFLTLDKNNKRLDEQIKMSSIVNNTIAPTSVQNITNNSTGERVIMTNVHPYNNENSLLKTLSNYSQF